MGNREVLLAAAKRCIYEKGYARTTARDVTSAAGVSLAAIGYHFGSLEALMSAALIEAIEDWSDESGGRFRPSRSAYLRDRAVSVSLGQRARVLRGAPAALGRLLRDLRPG